MQLQEQEQTQSLEYFTQLANLLRAHGVPEEEIYRAILSQYENPTPAAQPFPGPITGIDLAGNQPRFLVPDTGFPPVFTPNPIESTEFIPSVGPAGYLSLPTPDPLGSVKTNHPVYDNTGSNIGHTYNIENSPAAPSENWLGLANDPNSEPPTLGVRGYNFDMSVPPWRYDVEQSQSAPINVPPIAIFPSGATLEIRKKIRETLGKVNATWLDPDYIVAAKESAEKNGAKLYLVKAAEETVTDHRSEGEPYLRKLAASELQKMVRTAISKGTDINHMGEEFRTGGVIVDGEWDVNMEEMQYLVIESDPEINAAISRGDIDAVSINGGSPRKEVVEPCDHNCIGGACELCTVPVGVILAELDDIGFTWVAAKPFMWRGNMIQAATPGIKTTVIQVL
jgi:hypothetical protein